jgi:hypothetical protein
MGELLRWFPIFLFVTQIWRPAISSPSNFRGKEKNLEYNRNAKIHTFLGKNPLNFVR